MMEMERLASPPAGAPPDLVAAWPAMCLPVRARYAAGLSVAPHRRVRAFLDRWLVREAQRRLARLPPGASQAPLPPAARILAIRPDHLGDVLLTTPALRLLKAALPACEITVLAGPWGEDAARHCPAVDRLRLCRFPAFDRRAAHGRLGRLRHALATYIRLFQVAADLPDERFDLAIVFRPGDWWSAALAALAAVPRRLGYGSARAAPFLSHTLAEAHLPVGEPARAMVLPSAAEQSLALAREALALAGSAPPEDFDGRMSYEPTADERADAWRLWKAYDLDEAPAVVALHPSPGEPAKRWLPERFALVADHLAGHYGARIVLTGAASDAGEVRAVERACRLRPVVLAGQTSFGSLAALFERCRFVAGTDNGAMHLATARGVPALRLFGPTHAGIWGGWTGFAGARPPVVQSLRPCAPCHRLDLPPWPAAGGAGWAYPCMEDLTTEQVIAAVEQLWRATGARAVGGPDRACCGA